ncbi:MAG: lysylphosphatidylglycerol synthase transmembrane domain-containing protein [Acidimicrobiia bacterium]
MTDEAPEQQAEAKPTFGKQQIIAGIATVIILIIVFVGVLPQLGDYGAAWEAIKNMAAWELGLIVVATAAMIFIYALPFPAAMPGLRYWPAFKVRQTSFMISNTIPAGGAFGLAVQFGMLQSYGFKAAPSTATIGITSVWNTFVTLTLPVLGLLGLAIVGQSNGQATTITLIATSVVVIGIVVFGLILRSEELARKIGGWSDGAIQWFARLIRREIDVDATKGIVDFRSSIIDVVRDRWGLITLANVGQQLAQYSILYLAVVALQGSWVDPIGPWEALAAFSFGRLATFIPVPPGGLGTTDALITSILVAFGLDNNTALAATMIWRGATFFPQVVIGGITLIAFQAEKNRPGAVAAADPPSDSS